MKTLIEGIETVIDWLENDKVNYNWSMCNRCNMGLLSLAITGEECYFSEPLWSQSIKGYIDGGYENGFIGSLLSVGLSLDDIINLEFLRDDGQILEDWHKQPTDGDDRGYFEEDLAEFAKKDNLIDYLKRWLKRLQKDGVN